MIGVIMTESQWIEQAARIIEDRAIGCCIPSPKDAAELARDLYPLVQQAVAAERERCAKILKARASHLRTPEGCISAQWHSNDAFMVAGELERQAEAIRQMKDPNDDS